MGKKLAIKGHPTRGKEVIELFKMMGGCECGYCGGGTGFYYYISQFGNIEASCKPTEFDTYIVYTLEEFLEKYPFKVGDIVDRSIDYVSCVIDNMRWNSEKCCVEYHLSYLNGGEYGWHGLDCLIKPEDEDVITETKVESTGFMQVCKTAGIIFNDANYADEVELYLGDYEIVVRDGKTYAVLKKSKYPKTFDECLNVLYCKSVLRTIIGHKAELLFNLEKLLICRDAYWKIAGEEMGLDKPWEPDWNHINRKFYCIYNSKNNIVKNVIYSENKILAFPTEEMRDVFHENFKDLIEQCKELL